MQSSFVVCITRYMMTESWSVAGCLCLAGDADPSPGAGMDLSPETRVSPGNLGTYPSPDSPPKDFLEYKSQVKWEIHQLTPEKASSFLSSLPPTPFPHRALALLCGDCDLRLRLASFYLASDVRS